MTRRDPLADLDLLLVDGDNLLHDVRGERDEGGIAWLLPRLSGWRPPHLRIIVALDGHPAPGASRRQRAAPGIEFHHAGSRSADDLLIDVLTAQPYAGRTRTAVVTRDRGLQARARRAGGSTRSVDWLVDGLARPGAGASTVRPVSIGRGRRPPERAPDAPVDDGDRPPWRPGRGATKKRGNPRRGPKASRQR